MKDTKQTQTLCLGRFLVDVPRDADKVADTAEYRSRSVSQARLGNDAYLKMLSDKEQLLRSTKHKTEPSLLRELVKSAEGDTATFVFRESPTDAYQYKVQAFKWTNGRLFTFDSRADDDRVGKALEISARTLAELQYRRDNEIPTTPGFCIDRGLFAGEPTGPHYERAYFHLRFKGHPELMVTIYTRTNGEKVDEGLLSRVDGKQMPEIYKEAAKEIKTLRRGNHPVGNTQAEEILETYPTDHAYSTHSFAWESPGKPRDLYAPTIVVSLETGRTLDYAAMRPSLTDKQAIELFDSIVNSIRLRPNGSSAAPPENSPPPPRPQSKVPLGTTLAADTRCPQTGTWVCDHPDALGGHRRVFREGQTLPSIVAPVKLGLWQKLKGDAPNRLNSTAWTLVELPPEVAS